MNTSLPKFDVLQVKCNGFGSYSNIISKVNQDTILTYISMYRKVEDFEQLVNGIAAADSTTDYEYGPRCKNDQAITDRITSALAEHAIEKLEVKELAEMWINSQIEMLSGKNMTVLIKDALRDCASADHWYTHEKSWE